MLIYAKGYKNSKTCLNRLYKKSRILHRLSVGSGIWVTLASPLSEVSTRFINPQCDTKARKNLKGEYFLDKGQIVGQIIDQNVQTCNSYLS